MDIHFLPDSDLEDFSEAISEYQEIWRTLGERITLAWESTTGLKFSETYLNATIFHRPSFSHPLSLNARPDFERKKSILTHELGHRILYKRTVQTDYSSLENHKTLFLVLFDVFTKVYDEDFANRAVEWDRQSTNPIYGQAWDWALTYSKEERLQIFESRIDRNL